MSTQQPGPESPDETVADTHPPAVDFPLAEVSQGIPEVITDVPQLMQAAEALRNGTGPIAIDAERAGGYRYSQSAYLIQMKRTGSGVHLIDPIPFSTLEPIAAAIAGVDWVLHAASQDLPCLAELGLTPTRLFDTEVAARILGRPRVGLAALFESELGMHLPKEHSAADWSCRPLPEPWLRYATLDVEMLVELQQILADDLHTSGRWEWAIEEFEYVRTAPARGPRVDPWRRTSGIHKIRDRRGLEIVRQLWLARDRMAASRDIAVGRVLPDAAIIAAAASKPTTRGQLGALPAFSGRGTRRRLDYWWQAVETAQQCEQFNLPEPNPPQVGPPPPRSWPDRAPAAAARLARAREFLTGVSTQLGIPAENILTPDTARRLCWEPPPAATETDVENYLLAAGARHWQVALTCSGLTRAIHGGQAVDAN